MKKDNDTIKVSSESKLQLPLANLIGIIIVVSGAVFGYANLTGRISSLETADTLFAADLLKKAEQEPKNLEMYMLIEHLAGQIESIEKEMSCYIVIKDFKYFILGEGIEVEKKDFAAEVAEQINS